MINAKDAIELMARNSIDYSSINTAIHVAINEGSRRVEYYWESPDHHNVLHNYLVNLGYRVYQFDDFILIEW